MEGERYSAKRRGRWGRIEGGEEDVDGELGERKG